MTIQHLVLAGGGSSVIATCGALHSLLDEQYININKIKSIHATSAGTIISLLLCFHKLGVEFNSIRDYIISRPFHETFKIKVQHILSLYNKKGIYDENVALVFFKPFFQLLEVSPTITMSELYKLTGIELYFYATDVNQIKLVPFSFKDSPDLPTIYAIYMSSTIPIIFSPYAYINTQCYIDGGFLCNYPINQCIEINQTNTEEILGINIKYDNNTNADAGGYIQYNQDNNIIEFISVISYNIICFINNIIYPRYQSLPSNVTEFTISLTMTLACIKKLLFYGEERQILYENGYIQAKAKAKVLTL